MASPTFAQGCSCDWRKSGKFYRRAVEVGHVCSLTYQFVKYENEAYLLLPLGIQKLKGFQLQGASPLASLPRYVTLDPARSSAPDPRYRLALIHVCPPHLTSQRPYLAMPPVTCIGTSTKRGYGHGIGRHANNIVSSSLQNQKPYM